jgi:hypothetical protein
VEAAGGVMRMQKRLDSQGPEANNDWFVVDAFLPAWSAACANLTAAIAKRSELPWFCDKQNYDQLVNRIGCKCR